MFVAHVQKMKASDVRGMQIHFNRESENLSNKDIDRSKTAKNLELSEWQPDLSYSVRIKKLLKDNYKPKLTTDGKEKELRKDATLMCSVVVSADNDFFEKLDPWHRKEFFIQANQWLKNKFPYTVASVVHYDETTPHMHYAFVPLTEDGRLSAKEIVDRKTLLQIQDRLPAFISSNAHIRNIKRGEKGSRTRHKDVQEFKREFSQGEYYNARNEPLNTIQSYCQSVLSKSNANYIKNTGKER